MRYMARYFCYFCSKEITKLTGRSSSSLCIHHLNGNHNDDRPINRVNAHIRCHGHYHSQQLWNDSDFQASAKQGLLLGAMNRQLHICRICGFDLKDNHSISIQQFRQHQHALKQHLKECHPDCYFKHTKDLKLRDYFMTRTGAQRLELSLTKSPNISH